ncbi:unnamed protein product (macronuclear) [Paramecium tetraurelia]|uniref:Uncharacterized protein n=1 Tax=Paramecium tetraurelia TaxID=5888 RepID=A0BIH8_PARTE|nr:uncharacterized protein GSPATT00004717001 [Paramecium tetraurelia]CAK58345.1 unnamed protein product [Paramecium tetraurelia]|eukprot:XP_001425743.1 hypothetical protein (macronuclear) [Paramecium tetraurelia strain d4-2]
MSNEEKNQENEQSQKRQRRPRQHTNQEESDQFWKNNQYFAQGQIDDDDDDESEEYYPQQSSSASEEVSQENDACDFIDSLEQWEDCSESKVQQQQYQESPSKNFLKLMRKNLEQFSTMRGVHTQVDIATLPRLGETSYVYFNEEQKFKNEFQDVLNRFYKSIPCDKQRRGGDDQSKCKTEFHGDLFDFEDKRYFIDIEILQLQRILKLYKTQKFDSYLAYRKLTRDQNLDFEQSLYKQLDILRQKKKQLEAQMEEEKRCYKLSIDQQYILKLKEYANCFTPRYIQSQSNTKYDQMQLSEKQTFQIYPYEQQPQWLVQYQETFHIFKQKISLLQAPLYFYSFQDANALKISSHLILKSLKQLEEVSKNKQIAKIFIDLMNSLFNIDIPEADLLFNSELLNEEIISILTSQEKQTLLDQSEQYKPFPTPDDPGAETQTKLKFYPNFKTEDYSLYVRPVFEFSMRFLYEIYLRIQKITQMQTKIAYKNKEYSIGNLIIECCYKYLEDEISYAAWLTICKSILNEKDSIELSILIQLVQMFRRLFYQYDEWTVELLINWISKVLGEDSKILKGDVQLSNLSIQDIILKLKNHVELSNAKMARIQTVDGLMIIHVFEFSQLY